MNIKTSISIMALVLFNSLFLAEISAIKTNTSGISLQNSEVEITYNMEEEQDFTSFECFKSSETINNGSSIITKTFKEIQANFGSEANKDKEILFLDKETVETLKIEIPEKLDGLNCFQQAGDYEVKINLCDSLENCNEYTKYFTVKASDPDPNKTVFENEDCDHKFANYDDVCTLKLQIRDKFGNKVTQLSGKEINATRAKNAIVIKDENGDTTNYPWKSGDYNIWEKGYLEGANIDIAEPLLADNNVLQPDANLTETGTDILSFVQGLRFGDEKNTFTTNFENVSAGIFTENQILGLAGGKTFKFKSFSPSLAIKKFDNGDWQETVSREFLLDITDVNNINNDGTIDTNNKIEIKNISAGLKFYPPMEVNIDVEIEAKRKNSDLNKDFGLSLPVNYVDDQGNTCDPKDKKTYPICEEAEVSYSLADLEDGSAGLNTLENRTIKCKDQEDPFDYNSWYVHANKIALIKADYDDEIDQNGYEKAKESDVELCAEIEKGHFAKIKLLQNDMLEDDGSGIFSEVIRTGLGITGNIIGQLHRSVALKYQKNNDANSCEDSSATSEEGCVFPLPNREEQSTIQEAIGYPDINNPLTYFDADKEDSQLLLPTESETETPNEIGSLQELENNEKTPNYVASWEFFSNNGEPRLQFKTSVKYGVLDKKVSYYAGQYGYGSTGICLSNCSEGKNTGKKAKIYDILIEGVVVGEIANLQDSSDIHDVLTSVTGSSENDNRQTITENAWRLIRSAKKVINEELSLKHTDLDTQFKDKDVIIVDGKNVIFEKNSKNLQLPVGKKTLIIKDGNLFIDKDLYYENANDSFGIILVNSKTKSMPDTGNIYVDKDVKNITGTYFADGGLISYRGDQTNLSLNESSFTNQLKLTGMLMTQNTIGGAGDSSNYRTPWGTGTETGNNENAKKYDLRHLRTSPITDRSKFNINTFSGTINSFEIRQNPFILEIDRKVVNYPPPGFTKTGVIK